MTQTRRAFLKTTATLATIATVPLLPGCDSDDEDGAPINQAWEDRAEQLEQITWTAGNPGDKPEVHIPESTYDASARSVTVAVPHVMVADHWITTIYIRDQDGVVIGLQEYAVPTAEAESPTIDFPLPSSTTRITAYAYCNLHDNWAEDSVST